MEPRKLAYLLATLVYGLIYLNGGSWTDPDDPSTWARFIFIVATMLLLGRYELVPAILTCPYFYTLYKIVAGIIVANILLVTIWYQIEEFLKFVLAGFAGMFEHIPPVNHKLEFGEDPQVLSVVYTLVAAIFMLWVLRSLGYIPEIKLTRPCPPCPPVVSPPISMSQSQPAYPCAPRGRHR